LRSAGPRENQTDKVRAGRRITSSLAENLAHFSDSHKHEPLARDEEARPDASALCRSSKTIPVISSNRTSPRVMRHVTVSVDYAGREDGCPDSGPFLRRPL
jgi:hypothetical protein